MMILASGNDQDTEILSLSSQPVLPTVSACILHHTLHLKMPAFSYFSPQHLYIYHCWYSLSCTSTLVCVLAKDSKFIVSPQCCWCNGLAHQHVQRGQRNDCCPGHAHCQCNSMLCHPVSASQPSDRIGKPYRDAHGRLLCYHYHHCCYYCRYYYHLLL